MQSLSIFGNKNKGNKTIALVVGNEVITNDEKLAQTFNQYFVNIVLSLGSTSFCTKIMIILIILSQNVSVIPA